MVCSSSSLVGGGNIWKTTCDLLFSKPLRDCDDHKIDQDDEDDLCQGASIPRIRVGACVTLPPSPGGDKIPTHFPSLNLAHFTLH